MEGVAWILATANAIIGLANSEVLKAPAVIDSALLSKYLNSSIWALVGLNLIALGLFLASLASPVLKRIKNKITQLFTYVLHLIQTYREHRRSKRIEKPAAEVELAPPAISTVEHAVEPPDFNLPMPDLPPLPDLPPELPPDLPAESEFKTSEKTEVIPIPSPEILSEVTIEETVATAPATPEPMPEPLPEPTPDPLPEPEVTIEAPPALSEPEPDLEIAASAPPRIEQAPSVASEIELPPPPPLPSPEENEITTIQLKEKEVEQAPTLGLPPAPEFDETNTEMIPRIENLPLSDIESMLAAEIPDRTEEISIFDSSAIDSLLDTAESLSEREKQP